MSTNGRPEGWPANGEFVEERMVYEQRFRKERVERIAARFVASDGPRWNHETDEGRLARYRTAVDDATMLVNVVDEVFR